MLRYGPQASALLIDDREIPFDHADAGTGDLHVTLDGVRSRVTGLVDGHEVYVRTRNGRFEVHWIDPFGMEDEEQTGADRVVAPLPGIVVALLVAEGATVEKGAPVLTLEVMKMEQTLRAPFAGTVVKLKCKVGDIVQEGIELAEIEPAKS
jgi:3-methylcrotonyl-CoA carboxylase alpha subunit